MFESDTMYIVSRIFACSRIQLEVKDYELWAHFRERKCFDLAEISRFHFSALERLCRTESRQHIRRMRKRERENVKHIGSDIM